uniref:Late embryogenesis abundant protein LEA-2 subgroup domain-containing protein n=1 Tax=Kalanchoe fedtschenkoi TaxID=63787 RepID=A0A7N0URS0_KALFE
MPPPRNPGNECCRYCCSTILTAGFTWLTAWIILVTAHAPRLSILFLQVPPLNISSTTSGRNATLLTFHLKLDNPNLGLGIHYRNLTTSFHYPPNRSSAIADVISSQGSTRGITRRLSRPGAERLEVSTGQRWQQPGCLTEQRRSECM